MSNPRSRASRISVSLNAHHVQQLQLLSEQEGRSLSNLCARLIVQALEQLNKASQGE